jgi:hypothetical protein
MKFYIASSSVERARDLAQKLVDAGHKVTSSWIKTGWGSHGPQFDEERSQVARRDLMDVTAADALILLSDEDNVPGGKHVEFGYAIALGKKVYVIGRRENIFHWHPWVIVFPNEKTFLRPFAKPGELKCEELFKLYESQTLNEAGYESY